MRAPLGGTHLVHFPRVLAQLGAVSAGSQSSPRRVCLRAAVNAWPRICCATLDWLRTNIKKPHSPWISCVEPYHPCRHTALFTMARSRAALAFCVVFVALGSANAAVSASCIGPLPGRLRGRPLPPARASLRLWQA